MTDNGFFQTHGVPVNVVDLVKSYQLGETAIHSLRGVSLAVRPQEAISIVGVSGCGKTTFLNLLGGVDTPDQGRIEIGGNDITKFTERELGRHRLHNVGFVFQLFNLIPSLTALGNLEVPMTIARRGNRRDRMQRAMSLLEMVGMAAAATKRPDELSGGEQQRVAIAVALANDPPLILADEPTGNLDSINAEAVSGLLMSLATDHGKTVIVATHDARVSERTHRRIRMGDGRFLATEGLS